MTLVRFGSTMKTKIHINQHVIKRNAKTGEREPVITCKTYKENKYGHEVIIKGDCKVVYLTLIHL